MPGARWPPHLGGLVEATPVPQPAEHRSPDRSRGPSWPEAAPAAATGSLREARPRTRDAREGRR
eukprot:3186493-Pyramimonas_sp.AAC.1